MAQKMTKSIHMGVNIFSVSINAGYLKSPFSEMGAGRFLA
jgi:hypothetical protein